ncbi:MAG: type II toxin-antitoxin system PrlF family antitoxin [Acidobacteriota bacterium]|nr:type II toxin-antitoxin system PrlF family antitoxin [Acidobacteriota bacterium]
MQIDKYKVITHYKGMLASSKITKKNQTTLPRTVLDALGLKPADRLVYEIETGFVILRAKTERLADLKERFAQFGSKRAYPVSIEEMHEAVIGAVAEKACPRSAKRGGPAKS